jgi:hypothetical protein
MEDPDRAITHNRQVLNLIARDHRNQSNTLSNLARAIEARVEILGETTDLEEAIVLHQQALALRPTGHPRRSVSLNNPARMLCIRIERVGETKEGQSHIF